MNSPDESHPTLPEFNRSDVMAVTEPDSVSKSFMTAKVFGPCSENASHLPSGDQAASPDPSWPSETRVWRPDSISSTHMWLSLSV
jgi:hypothetical protein